MSLYENKTAVEREAIAAARQIGEEAPKCAAYFDETAACDLRRSHLCGPSELAIAMRALWAR